MDELRLNLRLPIELRSRINHSGTAPSESNVGSLISPTPSWEVHRSGLPRPGFFTSAARSVSYRSEPYPLTVVYC